MSWEAGAMLLLAAALVGGVVWYERSRPPAQIVALVAALAALAAAGRVALSPVPNVVPTTDITLIAGYALGGPPGFAVGALAALASNFWLGQGPWTPWQMAGWGLTGIFGAALAMASGRRLGRYGLAAACGIAGLAYGALLDLSLMVTYGGEQSLERFLSLSARGIPFNLAHAAGNVALALVAGPALVRMLQRYRRRFEFAWPKAAVRARARTGPGAAAGAACVLAALVLLAPASRAPEARGAAAAAAAGQSSAVAWLRSAQGSDGGFATEPGGESSPGMTGWAALALEAVGRHPGRVRRGGPSALDYLRSTAGEISTTGDLERTILVLAAAGESARSFAGRDLVARLLARRGGDGSWGRQVNTTAYGVLALEAVGRRSGNPRSAAWLRGAANADGGWGFAPGAASDADSTGAALQALAAAGGSRAAIRSGVAYLRGVQRGGGGFALSGSSVNAQSTAWAVQGLLAAGSAPARLRTGGRSPLDYLGSLQAADGHYRYSGSSDQTPVWVTSQALLAVAAAPFPLRPVSVSAGSAGAGSAAGDTAATGGSSAGAGVASGSGGGGSGGGGKAGAAAAASGASAPPPAAAAGLPPAAATTVSGGDDDGSPTALVAGAVICALVAIGGGLVLVRRAQPGR